MAAGGSGPKLLVIVGPTASGKSDLAMRIAKEFNGEIIAADSWTVYKDFDIGTSKPSKADRAQVRHHLVDIAKAHKGFNAVKFKKYADDAIKDIRNRGKLPILVGGTGLYIDSVLFDFSFLPNPAPDNREKLTAMTIPSLIEVARRNNIDLSGIDLRNKRRIIRAIEAGGKKPTRTSLRPGSLVVGIKKDSDDLRSTIEDRIERMIIEGLEEEVRRLAKYYGWTVEPMKGIGYKEWQGYMSGDQTLLQTRAKIVSATMNLAKRQWTWFKRNPHITWFNDIDLAYEHIKKALNK